MTVTLKGDAESVFDVGITAVEAGDYELFQACVAELAERRTKLAQLRSEELKREWYGPDTPRPGTSAAVSIGSGAAGTFVTDTAIHELRISLVRAASKEVWLSSYVLADDEIIRECGAAQDRRVAVHVVVAEKQTRKGRGRDLVAALKQARCNVREVNGNHSKCLVADGRYVLLGSANLKSPIHRDTAILLDSPSLAAEVIGYLKTLG